MNSTRKGVEAGWFCQVQQTGLLTNEQYRKLGEDAAKSTFRRPLAQEQFLTGWLSSWSEPHMKDCQCEDCQFYSNLIDM